jgi:hypothetical protein
VCGGPPYHEALPIGRLVQRFAHSASIVVEDTPAATPDGWDVDAESWFQGHLRQGESEGYELSLAWLRIHYLLFRVSDGLTCQVRGESIVNKVVHSVPRAFTEKHAYVGICFTPQSFK